MLCLYFKDNIVAITYFVLITYVINFEMIILYIICRITIQGGPKILKWETLP